MTTIKQEIKDRVKSNNRAKAMLAYVLNKHQTTIERYLDSEDDSPLNTKEALTVIADELGIEKSEILI